jgi:hypothetical protein
MRSSIALTVLLLSIPVTPTPTVRAHGGQLDSLTIQEALELGRQGDPGPYTLHMNANRTGVAGAVYTPFVRIAMASKAARLQGRDLTAADLPDWLIAPVVYIALRWYCVDSACNLPTQPIDVTILPDQRRPFPPVWTSRNLDVLTRFGALASADTIAVAAFAVATITPGAMIRTCVWTSSSHCDGRGGVITEADIAAWR